MLLKGATVVIVRTIIPFPVLYTQLGSTFANLISNSTLHIEFEKDESSKFLFIFHDTDMKNSHLNSPDDWCTCIELH